MKTAANPKTTSGCSRVVKVVVGAVLCACAIRVNVQASPIVYIFSGIGSGTVGASSFNNAAFTLSVYSDTSDVAIVGYYQGPIYSADASSASIAIAGIGTCTFTEATRVFDTPALNGLGFSLSYVLGGYDLWDLSCPAFGSYNLGGPLGPVSATQPTWGAGIGNQPTTLGLLSLSAPTATFNAVMVPEPSAIYYCVMVLLGVLRSRRFIRDRLN